MNTGLAIPSLLQNPLMLLPLTEVMRTEIALLLRQGFHFFTVGDFLSGWSDPRCRRFIQQAFDEPRQAQQAAATCAAWMGTPAPAACWGVIAWWQPEPNEPSRPDPRDIDSARLWTWGETHVLLG